MVFLAGSSLDIGMKSFIVTRAHEVARNLKKLSSFDMGEREMREYAGIINSFKPKFIRGYASSLSLFANWLEMNDVKIHSPHGIFSTSEKLYPAMRKKISDSVRLPGLRHLWPERRWRYGLRVPGALRPAHRYRAQHDGSRGQHRGADEQRRRPDSGDQPV